MLYNYENNFNVLEKFENNDFQNILMGVDKFNPEEIVVINIFKKSLVINSILADKFRNKLSSLVMIEETDSELIVITRYNEGMPLRNYLENYDTTLKHRINFAYEFLKKISIYDTFDNFFKKLFIDEDQIIMKDDELLMNELLVMDNQSEIGIAEFEEVCQKIGSILDNIISAAEDESAKESIQEFIHNLKNNSHNYTDLNQIHEAFKKIYIYDMFLNDEKEDTEVHQVSDSNQSEVNNKILFGTASATIGAKVASDLLHKDETSETEDWESSLKSAFGRKDSDDSIDDTYDISEDDSIDFDSSDEDLSFKQSDSIDMDTDEIKAINLEKTDEIESENNLLLEDEEDNSKIEEDIITQEEEDQLQALFSQKHNDENIVENDKEKKKNSKWLIWLLLLLLLAFSAWGANTLIKNMGSSKVQPIVHIVKTRIGDNYFFENKTEAGESSIVKTEWKIFYEGELLDIQDSYDYTVTLDKEGNYEVQLRVLNDKNVWSEIEKHSFIHVPISNENGNDSVLTPEKMDNYTIPGDEEQMVKDNTIYRNGSYSYMMNFDEPGQKSFTIQDSFLDDKAIISLWLRSSDTDTMELTFKGFNNNNEVFTKVIKHTPILANQWEMKQFTVEVSKLIDSIEVTISDNSGQIWIDDFSINSYK